jgi:peptidoglycan-N-acetylglucosamine deacetylase
MLGLTLSWAQPPATAMGVGIATLGSVVFVAPTVVPSRSAMAGTLVMGIAAGGDSRHGDVIEHGAAHERGGNVLFSGPADAPMVALTFDDGPSPTLTPRVLELLAEHDAHATFFVLGEQAERYPEVLRAIVEAGQELGSHGFSHRSFRSLFPSEIAAELDRTARAISSVGGAPPTLVRPPFGRFPESSVDLLASRGEDLVLWTVDGGDSDHADAERIAHAVVRDATPGAIVLLHDREPDTVYALPAILSGLARKGLRAVSVSELLDHPGPAGHPGVHADSRPNPR